MIDRQMGQRLAMTATGALAGLSFYNLAEALDRHLLPERILLLIMAWALVFFVGVLGMAGSLRLPRAAALAAPLATLVAGLLAVASLRFDQPQDLFSGAIPVLASVVLTFVPLPFLVARATGDWRDYPVLFGEAWAIVIRFATAAMFVLLVWSVLFLSDGLLRMVGVTAIGQLIGSTLFAAVINGAMFGLGVAVVDEHVEVASPNLLLRLLRLLLPVVLVVLLVFLAALANHRGERFFGSLSTGGTLLAIVGLCATLVTAAVDQSAENASRSVIVRRSAQVMAALLILPACLGGWAVALRVGQYGWTPDRILAAGVAALAVGYGLLYLLSVIRGRGWEARIRQANITMSLAIVALAAALLTPAIDPERLSAQSQLGRLQSGQMTPDQLDVTGLASWGRAGEAALEQLERLSAAPGQEALAARLAARAHRPDVAPRSQPLAELRAQVAANLPLRPESATAMRDAVLASIDAMELTDWARLCTRDTPAGAGSPCVMVVGDLWPEANGPQAIVLLSAEDGFIRSEGFSLSGGLISRHGIVALGKDALYGAAGARVIQGLLAASPSIGAPGARAIKVEGLDLLVVP